MNENNEISDIAGIFSSLGSEKKTGFADGRPTAQAGRTAFD